MPASTPSLARTSDAVVLLPGIMGSELVGADGKAVWGMRPGLVARQLLLRDVLRRLALDDDLSDDGVHATGPIGVPVKLPLLTSMEPYGAIEQALQKNMTLRPEAVLAFGYDWRRSIEAAGKKLVVEARAHLAQWRQRFAALPEDEREGHGEPRLSFVCHSMGGLVARWCAELEFGQLERGRDDINQIITLGTPFAGSLNAVQILADGDYLPFGLFAESLRDAARTLPGLYELVARYRCVVDAAEKRAVTVADLTSIGAVSVRAEEAARTHERLAAAVAAAGHDRCPVRSLVGTTQPTRQSVRFADGTAHFLESIDDVDERGDGTVYRYAASLKGGTPSYLPQGHGAIARTAEAIAFVHAALTERDLAEVQAPPGIGLRTPDAVRPHEPFVVELLDADAGGACTIHDAETNQLVTLVQPVPQDGTWRATATLPQPGLYRIGVASGGYSPVENLVLAIAD